jgi:hypothetical protein
MKTVIRYSLFGLLIYLLALALLFPADRAYTLIRDRLNLPLQLYQVSGRVWDGHVGLLRAAGITVKDVDWRLHILPLLTGRLELGLQVSAAQGPLQLVAGRHLDGSLYVHDDGTSLPVAEIEGLVNPQPMGLGGSIDVDLDDIRIATGRLARIKGNVVWHQAGIGAPVDITVGDLEATLTTKDDVVQATVKDNGGPLAVDGLLLLMPDNTYRLTLTLVARDKSRTDLRQALMLVGNPNRDGKVTLSRRGRLDLLLR